MKYADGTPVRFEREGAARWAAPCSSAAIARWKSTATVHHQPGRLREGRARPGRAGRKWEGDGWIARPHIQNWLDCIKSRELPNADVEIGHRSISVCHLVNITRELGRKLQWDPETEQFVGDDEANKLLDRPRRAGFELPDV